ncbi:MAG: hypothetical protein U0165_15255 [Polyangiaceae bacterium]
MLEFDPARAPTQPRPSATVLVLRENDAGLEIFCVVRHPKSTFLGGALAFPGGKVDPADGDERWAGRLVDSESWSARLGDSLAAPARALGIAACREALEEAALVPTVGDAIDDEQARELRIALESGASLLDELTRRNLVLDLSRLRPFARWVTPTAEARRYDATFFVMPLPAGLSGLAESRETTSGFWGTAESVLARWASGELQMAPPTTRAFELLRSCKTVAEALAVAEKQSLKPICPQFVADAVAPYLALPGDPSHEVNEVRVEGPTRFVLRDGRFVSEWPPK